MGIDVVDVRVRGRGEGGGRAVVDVGPRVGRSHFSEPGVENYGSSSVQSGE